ncbi:MAG: helix-turn-helix domain-containing protein [Hyphomicrobiaceae bacterium]
MDTSVPSSAGYLRDHLGDQLAPLKPVGARRSASSRTLTVQPRQHIFRQGDVAGCLYEITEGAVMLVRLLPDARRQVLEILGPGMWLGLTADGIHECSAEPLTTVTLRTVGLWAVQQPGNLQQRIARQLAARLTSMHDLAVMLGRKTGTERVASFLSTLARTLAGERRQSGKDHIQMNLRLADIADHLGLTIETVCREMTKLKRDRLISQSRDGTLILINPDKLAELANHSGAPRGRGSRSRKPLASNVARTQNVPAALAART